MAKPKCYCGKRATKVEVVDGSGWAKPGEKPPSNDYMPRCDEHAPVGSPQIDGYEGLLN